MSLSRGFCICVFLEQWRVNLEWDVCVCVHARVCLCNLERVCVCVCVPLARRLHGLCHRDSVCARTSVSI